MKDKPCCIYAERLGQVRRAMDGAVLHAVMRSLWVAGRAVSGSSHRGTNSCLSSTHTCLHLH
jgi:hypothetical protein